MPHCPYCYPTCAATTDGPRSIAAQPQAPRPTPGRQLRALWQLQALAASHGSWRGPWPGASCGCCTRTGACSPSLIRPVAYGVAAGLRLLGPARRRRMVKLRNARPRVLEVARPLAWPALCEYIYYAGRGLSASAYAAKAACPAKSSCLYSHTELFHASWQS